MTGFQYVFNDLIEGLRNYHIWWRFGWLDIKLRYRRTLLGPFWLTLSFLASSAILTLVYTSLFKISTKEFVGYLVAGLSAWAFIAGMFTEGGQTFTMQMGVILERKMPLSIHTFRLLTRHLLIFCHNLIAVVLILVIFGVRPSLWTVLLFPAVLLILLNGVWSSILFGIAVTRFRDIQEIITVLISVTFLVTPIFWKKEFLSRTYICDLNPLYHFVEIIRAPLLGQPCSALSWYVVLCITVIGYFLMILFGSRFLRKVSYWL